MTGSRDTSSSKQQPNTDKSAFPTSLPWPPSTDSESDSESLSEFHPLPLPMFTDAETDGEAEVAADDAVAGAGKERLLPESVETGKSRDLASEIAAAVDFPATASREQILRIKKREEMEMENLLLDEIGAMFGPTWRGEEGESESEEER
jgi:hypothetical protein